MVAVTVVAVLAMLAATPGVGQPAQPESCSTGTNPDSNMGPICAVLSPPVTDYHLLDVPDDVTPSDAAPYFYSVNVSWRETTISCGHFFPRRGYPSGTQVPYQDEYAEWSHSNGSPDNCTHDAPSHPGTIKVNAWPIIRKNLLALPIDIGVLHCDYNGSEGGVGGACEPASAPTCEIQDRDGMVITPPNIGLNLFVKDGDVHLVWDDPSVAQCTLPVADVDDLLIVPGPGGPAGTVTVRVDQAWAAAQLSAALHQLRAPGGDLVIKGTGGNNAFSVDAIQPFEFLKNGGLTIDTNGDGVPDIGGINLDKVTIQGGGGNDKFQVGSPVFDFFGGSPNPIPLNLEGGSGNDTVIFGAGDPFSADLNIAIGSGNNGGQVNLITDGDNTVDAFLHGLEKFRLSAGTGNDMIDGGGGSGTGDATALPLSLFGLDGDDTLIGGKKSDKLDGGSGNDTCDGGGGSDKGVACETLQHM